MSWAPEPEKDGLRRYNCWAGNPGGIKENTSRCIEQVHGDGIARFHQCERKRGHGPDGLYCKQHNPEAVARRKAEQEAAWKRKSEIRFRPIRQLQAAKDALKEIAHGHYDARGLAADILKKWNNI